MLAATDSIVSLDTWRMKSEPSLMEEQGVGVEQRTAARRKKNKIPLIPGTCLGLHLGETSARTWRSLSAPIQGHGHPLGGKHPLHTG